MPTISKVTLIKLMPYIAAIILVIGLFLPVSIGVKALLGFIFGLAGRAIFPYYMAWRENAEELKFNYAYLMPIVALLVAAILSGLAGFADYVTLVAGDTPYYLVYAEAIIFAYGGVGLLNGWRKWLGFFELLWQTAQGLIDLEEEEPVVAPPVTPEPAPVAPAPEPAKPTT